MVSTGIGAEDAFMLTEPERQSKPFAEHSAPPAVVAGVDGSDAADGGSTLEVALRQQRPVICAVDRDDLAPDVLATAAVLAAQLAVPLTVIHSPDPDVFLTGEPRRAALERGNTFVEQLSEGFTLDGRVVELDDPARLVIAVAREGASMIVIGTRGRTGLRAALLGSVSQTVIRSATCPVLAIPPAASTADVAPDVRPETPAWLVPAS
jgi:nucleotide-binding universal stress UspA family protein